jgi:hypothetical protein
MTAGSFPRPPYFFCPDCKRTTYVGQRVERTCEYCFPRNEMEMDFDDRPPPKRELPDYPD